ncbi:MAG: OsmC family protein [Deltaproteobacteria bacterium]|nr:OsmC family protein [Deltaproteobacteria bacterium]
MGPGSARVTPQRYQATGTVRAGGEGRLDAHGLAAPFDGTAGRIDELPGPADVLCAALSACILKNVERFSHLLPFRYESATVHVVAEREEPPPRIVRMRYELELVTDEPESRIELLHRNIQKFGTITNTLGKACDLSGTIRAIANPS